MPTKKALTAEQVTAMVNTPDQAMLAEIRAQGGGEPLAAKLPMFKLEHVSDGSGEPNPLRGHFTLAKPNDLGEYEKKDLGESVRVQFLYQRYYLDLVKGDVRYSSKEFDTTDSTVALFQSTGFGDSRVSSLYAEGTPYELGKSFLITDSKGKQYSELKLKYVVYAIIDNGLAKWKMNGSATRSYRQYQRMVLPYAVITEVTRSEQTKGTNKYYVPELKAVEKITDLKKVLEEQKDLKELILGTSTSTDLVANGEGE